MRDDLEIKREWGDWGRAGEELKLKKNTCIVYFLGVYVLSQSMWKVKSLFLYINHTFIYYDDAAAFIQNTLDKLAKTA